MVQALKGDGKAIFTLFVGAMIAIALLIASANTINLVTNTLTITNKTTAAPANGAVTDINGRNLVGTFTIVNSSNGAQVATNITLADATSSTTGLLTIQIQNNATTAFAGENVNITYTYEPDGYARGASTRSIIALVLIFGSLAVLVFTIVVFVKDGSLGEMMRSKPTGRNR